jgi:hypothetical protein
LAPSDVPLNPIAQLLNAAFAAHKALRLPGAQRLYERVLEAGPDHLDASTWVPTKGAGASWATARHPRRYDADRHAI